MKVAAAAASNCCRLDSLSSALYLLKIDYKSMPVFARDSLIAEDKSENEADF